MKRLMILISVLVIAGCSMIPRPQKGGKVRSESNATNFISEATQPENPAGAASQSQEAVEETHFTLPTHSKIIERTITPSTIAHVAPTTNEIEYIVSEPVPVTKTVQKRSQASVGGAQKDEGRVLGVKLNALKPIMFAGLAMFVAAGVLMYFSHWMAGGIAAAIGVAMLVLFVTLPQYGVWIMGVGLVLGVGAIALIFLAYHKGKDENKNGIPDWVDELKAKMNEKAAAIAPEKPQA